MHKKMLRDFLFFTFLIMILPSFAFVGLIKATENYETTQCLDLESQMSNMDIEKLLAQLEDADLSDESKGIFADIASTPDKMAERLPEDLRENILNTVSICGRTVSNTRNLFYPLLDVMCEIKSLAELIHPEQKKEILEFVEEVDSFFSGQKFSAYAQHGLFVTEVSSELEEFSVRFSLLIDDFKKNFNFSGEVCRSEYYGIKGFDPERFFYLLKVFYNSLDALGKQDGIGFRTTLVNFMLPEVEKSIQLLEDVMIDVEMFAEQLIKGEDDERLEAVAFWRDVLSDFEILKSFGELSSEKRNFIGNLYWLSEKFSPVMPFIVGGYTLCRKAFQLREIEKKISFAERMQDYSVRALILPLHVLKRIAEIRKSTANLNMQRFLILNSLRELTSVFADSNFYIKDQGFAVRSFYRIFSAFAYYHTFYRYSILGKSAKGEVFSYWDPNNRVLKRSLWFALRDGYRTFAHVLENKIFSAAGRNNLKEVENYSFGLIKPDLITFAFNTAMPIFAEKYFPKDIANLEKSDVFAKEIKDLISLRDKRFLSPLGFAFDYIFGSDSKYYVGNRSFSTISNKEYVRNRILGYLAVNLGSNLGKKFARKFPKPFRFFTDKGINLVGKGIHTFFSDELDRDELIMLIGTEGIQEALTSDISVLEEVIAQCVDFLVLGEEGDTVDAIIINQMIYNMKQVFFGIIVNLGIMSQLEVAKFEEKLLTGRLDDRQKEAFAKKITLFFKDKLALKLGGFVGGFTSWVATDYLVRNYSDQIDDYINRVF